MIEDAGADLGALIGARICHDLVSPVGAISNGLELLALARGAADGPEMALIVDSCASAQARIAFYRLAFGCRDGAERMAAAEAAGLAANYLAGTRLRAEWSGAGDLPRFEAQLALLGLLCVEAALPRGGRVAIARDDGRWRLAAEGPRVLLDPELWGRLAAPGGDSAGIAPAQVEFALLGIRAAHAGRRPEAEADAQGLTLRI